MTDSRDFRYDIVIAGGGMIGTSLALALAPLGLRVAIVEAVARREAAQPSFDDRSTALSRRKRKVLPAMVTFRPVRGASEMIRTPLKARSKTLSEISTLPAML